MKTEKIKTLEIKNKLAPNPKNKPQFHVEISDTQGNKVVCADPNATRAAVALMNQHAVIGGAAAHWGGPAAFAEIMSATHAIMFQQSDNWYEHFNFVNDAGHAENGIYALRANYGFDNLTFDDLKKFRSIDSKLTGHGEAHLNPEGVFISNGPLGSGLPQAQGLALGDKITNKNRVTICCISDGASMEGEAKEAFASIPGLAARDKLNPFVMLVSDNNTKLSGRIDKDSFSMTPTFDSLKSLGWETITVEQGHNLENVYHAINNGIKKAKQNSSKPIAIIFKTIKGYGVQLTQDSSSGGHGYPLEPFDERLSDFVAEVYSGSPPDFFKNWAIEISKSKPKESSKAKHDVINEKTQKGLARAAIKAADNGLPVFSISSDLQGSTGIADFHKKFPDRYIDIGVAEANMISVAAGLSKQGFIPIVDTFAQFGVTKGNLPLTMASLSQAPIIALFSHTGFQDAADGASHQATTYLAATSSLPYTNVINCSCSDEAEFYLYESIKAFQADRENDKIPNSTIIFLGRENFPQNYGFTSFQWAKAQLLRKGDKLTIIATGPQVKQSLIAAKQLSAEGIEVSVINNSFINKPDRELIINEISKTSPHILTVEDHQIIGGMGSLLAHELAKSGVSFKMTSLGINNRFGQSAYKADHLYKKFGNGIDNIIQSVKAILQ